MILLRTKHLHFTQLDQTSNKALQLQFYIQAFTEVTRRDEAKLLPIVI